MPKRRAQTCRALLAAVAACMLLWGCNAIPINIPKDDVPTTGFDGTRSPDAGHGSDLKLQLEDGPPIPADDAPNGADGADGDATFGADGGLPDGALGDGPPNDGALEDAQGDATGDAHQPDDLGEGEQT